MPNPNPYLKEFLAYRTCLYISDSLFVLNLSPESLLPIRESLTEEEKASRLSFRGTVENCLKPDTADANLYSFILFLFLTVPFEELKNIQRALAYKELQLSSNLVKSNVKPPQKGIPTPEERNAVRARRRDILKREEQRRASGYYVIYDGVIANLEQRYSEEREDFN